MIESSGYFIVCDTCDTDAGDTRPTVEEITEYAERGGWRIDPITGIVTCDDCLEGDNNG